MSSMLVAPKVDSVQLSMLAPCPDNATIYGAQSLDDPDILSLIASIREIGVTDPIRVSTEGVIISGHRRRFCAFQAGVRMVPVIREPISSWLRAIGKLLMSVDSISVIPVTSSARRYQARILAYAGLPPPVFTDARVSRCGAIWQSEPLTWSIQAANFFPDG